MRRPPKTLQLMSHTVNVQILSKKEWEEMTQIYEEMKDSVGYWHPQDFVIFVLRGSKSLQLHSFFHELLHAILDNLNHPLSRDEAFVDNLAGLLTQAMLTAR